MALVSCKICGKQMNRKPSKLNTKSGHSFCSLKCAGEYWAGLALQKKRESEKETNMRAPNRVKPVLLVDRGLRPVNPMAREAWDRRIMAGEIKYSWLSKRELHTIESKRGMKGLPLLLGTYFVPKACLLEFVATAATTWPPSARLPSNAELDHGLKGYVIMVFLS